MSLVKSKSSQKKKCHLCEIEIIHKKMLDYAWMTPTIGDSVTLFLFIF